MIAVVDYGGGNLNSVVKAFDYLGATTVVSRDAETIRRADQIVLPGVGAFGDAAAALKKTGLDRILRDEIAAGKPFFGICLGMQLLFEQSEESPGVEGLKILKGTIKKFPPADKVPHVGWNNLKDVASRVLDEGAYMYFVHSFYAGTNARTSAATDYAGVRFSAAVEFENVIATQFHPEKSGDAGLEILRRFLTL